MVAETTRKIVFVVKLHNTICCGSQCVLKKYFDNMLCNMLTYFYVMKKGLQPKLQALKYIMDSFLEVRQYFSSDFGIPTTKDKDFTDKPFCKAIISVR